MLVLLHPLLTCASSLAISFCFSTSFPLPGFLCFFLASRVGSRLASPFVLKSLCALSSKVPPHLSPRAMSADLSLSSPKEANSSQEEKADSSKCAPT